MSPTAFKDTLATLLIFISKSHDLCFDIRRNRHLPHKTAALDTLQSALSNGVTSLQDEFNTLRRAIGSRMDLGDELSRSALVRASRELEGIKTHLTDVAYRRDDRGSPGFRALNDKFHEVKHAIKASIIDLGRRLTSLPVPSPSPSPSPRPMSRETDEVTIKMKEWRRMEEHMRCSWVEKFVAGRVCYVNVLDEKRITWERPEGFVQFLPASRERTKSWEREELPRGTHRVDSWSGW